MRWVRAPVSVRSATRGALPVAPIAAHSPGGIDRRAETLPSSLGRARACGGLSLALRVIVVLFLVPMLSVLFGAAHLNVPGSVEGFRLFRGAAAQAASPQLAEAGSEWRAAIKSLVSDHPMLAGQNLKIDYPSTLPRWPLCKTPRALNTRQGIPVGRVSIALRCNEPRWQGAIQVVVVARRTHFAASRALQAGFVIDADAIVAVESDWASLPEDVVTEPEQVLGRALVRAVSAGTALTLNLVRQTAVIRNGERVRVQMSGANFVVAGEGQRMQAGSVGEQIRIKMGSGQVVTAVIVRQGLVELRVD